jgi:hypothetical protein
MQIHASFLQQKKKSQGTDANLQERKFGCRSFRHLASAQTELLLYSH